MCDEFNETADYSEDVVVETDVIDDVPADIPEDIPEEIPDDIPEDDSSDRLFDVFEDVETDELEHLGEDYPVDIIEDEYETPDDSAIDVLIDGIDKNDELERMLDEAEMEENDSDDFTGKVKVLRR